MARVGDEVQIDLGPWTRVLDSSDPGGARGDELLDAINMVDLDHGNGSAMVARHGMVGLASQLGSASSRTGQCVFHHRRPDGTLDRFTFGGGKMYTWDGLSTFTDITPAGVTIDPTNPVFCASFNGEVIVSDETNKPWIYTPETGAAVNIEVNSINDEWRSKGGPIVYSGYLFFILSAIGVDILQEEDLDDLLAEDGSSLYTELLSGFQNGIIWSEPLDPRLGYDQDDYDHVWELTQTSNEVLGALFAEEGALIYWRNTGIGQLTGAVDDNFRNSSTRDSVSNTIGSDAAAAVLAVNKKVFFVDMDGRPYVMTVGGGEPQRLWLPLRREVAEHFGATANRANVVAYARAAYHPEYDLVLFTIWDRTTLYAFDATTGHYIGTWTLLDGAHVDAMGALTDSENRMTFVILGTRGTTYQLADQGVFWRQKHQSDSSQWLDQADASVSSHTAFTRRIVTHYVGHRSARRLKASRVIVELLGSTAAHAVRLQYKVPTASYSTALVAQSTIVVAADGFAAQDEVSRAAFTLGRNAQGSTFRLLLEATHTDNVRFGVHNATVFGQVTEVRPRGG